MPKGQGETLNREEHERLETVSLSLRRMEAIMPDFVDETPATNYSDETSTEFVPATSLEVFDQLVDKVLGN